MVASGDPASTVGLTPGDEKSRLENERFADALFESRSLDEIKEVRSRAAHDAGAKDEELRTRVGSSYRDAIATADDLFAMETTAKRAAEILDKAVKVLTDLPRTVASIETNTERMNENTKEDGSNATSHEDALYAAGTRVKFLVDTPEKIWGSLEERDTVGAARRFLAASDVLVTLEGKSDEIQAAFPLVKQQLPLLKSFKTQISRAARTGLADAPERSTPTHVADALAAVCCVENVSAHDASQLFLQTRRAWIRAALRRVGRDAKAPRVAAALAAVCREARRVPGVLVACFGGDGIAGGEDFADDVSVLRSWGASSSNKNASDTSPLLLAAIAALDGTDVDTSVRDTHDSNNSTAEKDDDEDDASPSNSKKLESSSSASVFRGVSDLRKETSLRTTRASTRLKTLGALPTADSLALQYREWLTGVALDIEKAVSSDSGGIFRGIKTLAHLADVEKRVAAAEKRHSGADGSNHDILSAADGHLGVDAVALACERVRLAMLSSKSETLSIASTKTPWSQLAEAPHAAHARELLQDAFTFKSLRSATDMVLKAAKIAPPTSAGSTNSIAPSPEGKVLWTEGFRAVDDATGVAANETADAKSTETHASREAREAREAPTPPTRKAANGLAKEMALSFARTRRDIVAFSTAGDSGKSKSFRSSKSLTSRDSSINASGVTRLARLESFAHKECANGISAYVAFLSKKLDGFEKIAMKDGSDSEKQRAVEQTLLVALAARCASDKNTQLALFLGPSSSWEDDDGNDIESSTTRRRRRAVRRAAPTESGALASSIEALRSVAARGFHTWAEHCALAVGHTLSNALASDSSLHSETNRIDWEPDPVAVAAGITTRLPSVPSPYAFHVAHVTCLEALRCGGHALPHVATKTLTARVARVSFKEFHGRFVSGADLNQISEKGALQALFDAQFLANALLDSSDTSDNLQDTKGIITEAQQLLQKVSKKLSSILDPIDWATFEQPLTRNVQRAIQRSATVLGLAARRGVVFSRKNTNAAVATGNEQQEDNAPPLRFAYLPVGAPSFGGQRFGINPTNSGVFSASYRSASGRFLSRSGNQNLGGELLDWSAAGFDKFENATESYHETSEGGGNFFGKLAGQGLGLGKAAAASMSTWAL